MTCDGDYQPGLWSRREFWVQLTVSAPILAGRSISDPLETYDGVELLALFVSLRELTGMEFEVDTLPEGASVESIYSTYVLTAIDRQLDSQFSTGIETC